jgi:hypothetical protein
LEAFIPLETQYIATSGSERKVDVGTSALAALAYADLFDYPLSVDELVRYQIGTSFSAPEIQSWLQQNSVSTLANGRPMSNDGRRSMGDGRHIVVSRANWYTLPGRESNFEKRRARKQASARVWKRAKVYSHWISRMPFVRMAAITGALAVDNIAGRPDIDLLIVSTPGRVWICRRGLIMLVRLARFVGDDLCPNYVLSRRALALDQRDFFTAHELAQMVPMFGVPLYTTMIGENLWARHYLPRAFEPRELGTASVVYPRTGAVKRVAERVLGLGVMDGWERWELKRLRTKLAASIGEAAEVVCSPDQCKGHTGLHRQTVMSRFRSKLRELGLERQFQDLLHDL